MVTDRLRKKGIMFLTVLLSVVFLSSAIQVPVWAVQRGLQELPGAEKVKMLQTDTGKETETSETSAGKETETSETSAGKETETPETSAGKEVKIPETSGGKEAETPALEIDGSHLYDGMDKTYAEGYVPQIKDGRAELVLPLVCNGEPAVDKISVRLSLGEDKDMPFVHKNYKKDVTLETVQVSEDETVEVYLVKFSLELKADRKNGSWPVTVSVSGKDVQGQKTDQKIDVYVTVTDGITDNPAEGDEQNNDVGSDDGENLDTGTAGGGSYGGTAGASDVPSFAPKVIISSRSMSVDEPQAGEKVTVSITLQNTNKTEGIRNMTVTAKADSQYFALKDDSDTLFIERMAAGESKTISYTYEISGLTPQGQYAVELSMDYADTDGMVHTGSGQMMLPVYQPVNMSFDKLNIGSGLYVGDVVKASVQAMNLGKGVVYNLRAVIQADGLEPEGTVFFGNLEAGATSTGEVSITVTNLGGDVLYGDSDGTVTYYYEDSLGRTYEETEAFTTSILSPFTQQQSEQPEDEPGQWWILMTVTAGLLLATGTVIVFQIVRQRMRNHD